MLNCSAARCTAGLAKSRRLTKPARAIGSEPSARKSARSRLYRSRFLQLNTHFAAFFEIYNIFSLAFQILRNFFRNFAKFSANFQNFAVRSRFCDFFAKFPRKFVGILQNVCVFWKIPENAIEIWAKKSRRLFFAKKAVGSILIRAVGSKPSARAG